MLKEELMKKLDELCQDTRFAEELAACEDTDAMVTFLKTTGINTSVSELEEVLVSVSAQGSDGELSEDTLDTVSGGCIFGALYAFLYKWKKYNFSAGGGNGSFGGGAGGGGGR